MITQPASSDFDELLSLWETSVRSTHHFLTKEDILFYKPLIRNEYFKAVELYIIRNPHTEKIVAFMGLSHDNIEMLFTHPSEQAKGYGKELIEYAIHQKGIRKVDVNEQNEKALRFYLNRGFETIGRDAFDAQGKPYPILHLRLKPFRLRNALIEDIDRLYNVFETSIRNTCYQDYTSRQIEAWIGKATPERWLELLQSELQFIIVEETSSFHIVGFTSINTKGYLHSMFITPEFQNKGLASLLLQTAEEFSRKHQATSIFSEVSLTAYPFFKKQGFITEKEQTVIVNQIEMTNFVMRKTLK